MIPYFFRHYNGLVDRFVIYDNGSTDGSLQLLAGDERVAVVHWDVRGDSLLYETFRLTNEFWKQSRGHTNWVVTAEIDEHLHHPQLLAYLDACAQSGITAIQAIGYDMIADAFPTQDKPLWQAVTRGVRAFGMDKMAIFDPVAIKETNYEVGRHEACPTGRVVSEPRRQVRLLHYKFLGPEYVAQRNALLSKGIRPGDREHGWGAHWLLSYDEVVAQLRAIDEKAAPLPGLRAEEATGVELAVFDEREVLGNSRLFRRRWYLSEYPDVAKAGVDPLEHFCREGWREMRRPNRHFDPAWYRRTYADALGPDTNPLLDYVVIGEKAGRRPVPYFDPAAYRVEHGLAQDDSPLAHYLTPSAFLRTLGRAAEKTQKALWRWRRSIRHSFGRFNPDIQYKLFRLIVRLRAANSERSKRRGVVNL